LGRIQQYSEGRKNPSAPTTSFYLSLEKAATTHQVEATKRLWTEPGRGVVDFDAVTAAMPEDYDGDYMIEVVEPSVDSLHDSFKLSFEWARHALNLAKP
jgi:inosose dehydratase